MRKILFTIFLLLLMANSTQAKSRFAPKPTFGIGGYFGVEVPVTQDDQGDGTAFGIKLIIKAMPIITLEPFFTSAQYGKAVFDVEGVTMDLEGSKLISYGLDAVIGAPIGTPGFNPYFVGGIGYYKFSREQTNLFDNDKSELGYAGGMGFKINLNQSLSLDVRGKFNVIPVESNSSRKSLSLVGGLNFYFRSY